MRPQDGRHSPVLIPLDISLTEVSELLEFRPFKEHVGSSDHRRELQDG
jgi:hypothetical protein